VELTLEELIEHAKNLARPIKFDALEKRGLLVKRGGWYQVPNIHKLPDYVAYQVRELWNSDEGLR
jgi:hypothetical protein